MPNMRTDISSWMLSRQFSMKAINESWDLSQNLAMSGYSCKMLATNGRIMSAAGFTKHVGTAMPTKAPTAESGWVACFAWPSACKDACVSRAVPPPVPPSIALTVTSLTLTDSCCSSCLLDTSWFLLRSFIRAFQAMISCASAARRSRRSAWKCPSVSMALMVRSTVSATLAISWAFNRREAVSRMNAGTAVASVLSGGAKRTALFVSS
mmetsp:Transcript_43393/g.100002  ORF Transcript_43393/g.100002 Transcript_43393/m.100002 type:complete len:209 (+) Transcript_43393:1648-2274(+)